MSKINGYDFNINKKITLQTSGVTSFLGGSNVETILNSVFVPANTFSVGDLLTLEHTIRKSGTAGITQWKLYYNTSNNLSGAIQIANRGETSTFLYLPGMRRMAVRSTSNNTYVLNSSASIYTDFQGSTSAPSTLSLNWTVDSYIILTSLTQSTDTASCVFLKIGN